MQIALAGKLLQHRMTLFILTLMMMGTTLILCAEGPDTNLMICVEAPAAGLPATPPASRNAAPGFFADIPGVALRSQGYGIPQADLSILGEPFSSSGLMLAGLPLYNPQTEHFQCDLPVPADVFQTPQLLTGLDQFRKSSGHPGGSVGLNFAPITGTSHAEAGGGPGEQFGNIRVCNTNQVNGQTILGESGFANWGSIDHTDGYKDNYLNYFSGGAQIQARQPGGELDLLGAYGFRQFGAQGFYAAPAFLPSVEEVAEALVAGGATWAETPNGTSGHLTAAWQQVNDTYWLDRVIPNLYENKTLSDVASLHGDTHMQATQNLSFDLHADAHEEWIHGTHTGILAAPGLGTHSRGDVALGALPSYTMNEVQVMAGGSVEFFTDDQAAWLPAAGIQWNPTPDQTISLGYTGAVRQPSYTELYYFSPTSVGNANLERQETREFHLSWREKTSTADGGVLVFAQDGHNMVDWAKSSANSGTWGATNLVRVNTFGYLADIIVPVSKKLDLSSSYQGIIKESETHVSASRYVLDYPMQTVRIGVKAKLNSSISFSLQQEAEVYRKNPARAGTDVELTSCAEIRWCVWKKAGVDILLGVYNPWNNRFETYPGQPSSGTREYASVRHTW